MEAAAQRVLDARQLFMGSAGILPAASGIPAGRRAKAAGENANATEKTGADARLVHESFRQDAGKSGQDARAPQSTLTDLYDPLAMPPVLAAAHTALDKAVDKCYRNEALPTDRARVEHLFALYEHLTAPLAPPPAAAAADERHAGWKPALPGC